MRTFQTGWHSVLYDAALDPGGEWVYAVTWNGSPTISGGNGMSTNGHLLDPVVKVLGG